MIKDLAGLIAPLPVEDFLAQLRRREPLMLRVDGDVSALLDWDRFLGAALDPDLPARRFSLMQRAKLLPAVFYRGEGRVSADVVAKVMENGGSLVAYNAHRFVPGLEQLIDTIAVETGEHVIAALIGSTGNQSAYGVHYDKGDVLVVQVEGSKRWILQADPVIDPVPGPAVAPNDPAATDLMSVVLTPGEMLLVPAGYRHHCEMTGERSLHISVVFFPLTAARVGDLLLHDLFDQPAARRPIRTLPGEETANEAALKRLLIEQIEAMTLDELRMRHRDTVMTQGGSKP